MLSAILPFAIVLVAGLLARAVERSLSTSTGVLRALGASGAGVALAVTLLVWNGGARGTAGTFDGDLFSLYCSALLLATSFIVLAVSRWDSAGISKLLLDTAILLLVVSTRDLLWIGVALTLLAMTLLREHLRTGVVAATFWAGAVLLVWFGGGSDLAVIGASAPSLPLELGVSLTLIGVGLLFLFLNWSCWLLDLPLAARGHLSAGVWIACTAVLIRLAAWLDISSGPWFTVVALLGLLAVVLGGLGVLVTDPLVRLSHWVVLSQAGVGLVAVDLGVEAVAPLLLHLASSAIALVLTLLALDVQSEGADPEIDELAGLSLGRPSRLVLIFGWLTFVSLPPFPGFVARFPIFVAAAGSERSTLLVVLLLSTLLVAVGWTRLISRVLQVGPRGSSTRPRFAALALAVLALGFTLALGVLPENAIELASRAAAGLF